MKPFRPLTVIFGLSFLAAAALLQLSTGGLRLQVAGVEAPPPAGEAPEIVEVRLLYQNAPPETRIRCRWSAPEGGPAHEETLLAADTDGELVFRLTGFSIPAGEHRLTFQAGDGEPLEYDLLLPPRPPGFFVELRTVGQRDTGECLEVGVRFRHLGPLVQLEGRWSDAAGPRPELSAFISPGVEAGEATFRCSCDELGEGAAFTLLADGMFILRQPVKDE